MFEYGKEYKSMRSLLWYVISFAALLFVFMFVLLIADKRATCLENSGVWDEQENRCRKECLTWNVRTGCVELSADVLEKLDQCGNNLRCHDDVLRKIIPQLCQKYRGTFDQESGSCDFEKQVKNKNKR